MSSNLFLPVDVLCQIFSYCEPTNITEICREFAFLAYSVPSLWTSVHLRPSQLGSNEGLAFLRTRLARAGTLPLTISIDLGGFAAESHTVAIIYTTISEYNAQINRLEITAETVVMAAGLLEGIFPKSSQIFPALQVLSVRVEDDSGILVDTLPQLDLVLEDAAKRFPMLQTLSLSSFYDCVPVLPISSPPFKHLHTLILDGSLEQETPDIVLITALLHYTPQLESLWFKHYSYEQFIVVRDPFTQSVKGRADIRTPVHLPRLTHLAISVAGCATDLVECIKAPALSYLHIDGSRGPGYGEIDYLGYDWVDFDANSAEFALDHLAAHSPNVRHLAMTAVYLNKAGWNWLLFGKRSEPALPFPQLESLSLHKLKPTSGTIVSGFDDALLCRYAREPRLQLRRLVFFRCDLTLGGSSLVEAFRGAINRAPHESYELECDKASLKFSTEEDLVTLANLGVRLIRHQEVQEDEWWKREHQIDALDSHVY